MFGLTFGIMLAGFPVFLLGGVLVRNAIVRGPHEESWLDALLQSNDPRAFLGVLALVVMYPSIAVRRSLSFLPYGLLLLGIAMALGPMVYWGWWHGQLSP